MTAIGIQAGPYRFDEILEEALAPLTCAQFKTLLPYSQRLIHVRWSGEACWVPLGTLDLGIPTRTTRASLLQVSVRHQRL